MTNWNTRLAVSYVDANGASDIIAPIDSFTPTFAMNAEPIHSIEQTHVGVVFTTKAMTFTMTVRAVGPSAAVLTGMALRGDHFDIILQEQSGDDWAFDSVVLSKCLITNAVPTAATISGVPSATFSGFALGATEDPKSGESVTVP